MYYDYQRWYDPSTGRFISQDPVPGILSDPQSLNPYAYVYNDPASLTDPSGLYTGFNAKCPDSCTGSAGVSNADWLTAVIVALTSVDTHHGGDIGGLGRDIDMYRCLYECGSGQYSGYIRENEGGIDWSASDSETTGGEPASHRGPIPDAGPAEGGSQRGGVTIEVFDVSRAGFEEAQAEGVFGNQPMPLAEGNYAHSLLGPGQAPKALGPGSFPDQWDTNGFTEIKPYHEGIDPLQEYGPPIE